MASLLRRAAALARVPSMAGRVRPSLVRAVTIAAQRGMATDANTAQFALARPFKGHKLTAIPDATATGTKAELLGYLKTMTLYRRMEVVADTLYKAREIRGFCHLYDGQEAIVVGMKAAMKPQDSCIAAYRDHCHQVAFGDTPGRVLAELTSKLGGATKGKGGSMHMYYPKGHFYGGNGIVGAQVPLGAGLALAHKYRKDNGVSLAFYGDGAANQGQIFEAANMAALWKLPMIFVCENNEYGMGTSVKRASASTAFYTRGDYVPGIWVDGMDVLAVRKGFEFALDHCRSGKGPIFLEANTYRYHGHSMSDPGVSYRPRSEIDEVRATRDCIENVKHKLQKNGWATEADFKAIDKEAKQHIDKELEYAHASPFPPAEELWADVYSGAAPPFIRMPEYPASIKSTASA